LAQTSKRYNIRKQPEQQETRGFHITRSLWEQHCKGQYSPPHGAEESLKGTEVQAYVLNLSPKKVNGNAPTDFQEDTILPLKFRNTVKRACLGMGRFCEETPNNERGGKQAVMM